MEHRTDHTSRPDPAPTSTRRVLKSIIYTVVLLVIGFFITRSIYLHWEQIRGHEWQFNWPWLLLSAVIIWAITMLLMAVWKAILWSVAQRSLPFFTVFRILVLSNLGKYIPGRMWTVAWMVYMMTREGIRAEAAVATSLIHQAFMVFTGIPFILIILGRQVLDWVPLYTVIIGIILPVFVLYPPIFTRVLNFGLRLLKREKIDVRISLGRAIALYFAFTLTWFLFGTSFYCFLYGIGIEPSAYWTTVASFGAAYLIGLLALFAPGGLGIREGVMAVLLPQVIPLRFAALVAVASRLWMTLVELSQVVYIGGLKLFGKTDIPRLPKEEETMLNKK